MLIFPQLTRVREKLTSLLLTTSVMSELFTRQQQIVLLFLILVTLAYSCYRDLIKVIYQRTKLFNEECA